MSVIFDQLRISDDGKTMYIDAHVSQAVRFDVTGKTVGIYDNAYIDSITITTADRVLETNPNVPTSDYLFQHTFEGNLKEIHLELSSNDFMRNWETDPSRINFCNADMSSSLFFVYVKLKFDGVPDPCAPCSSVDGYTLGVTFDENFLYQKVMNYTRELGDDCNIPQGFIDFILLWNAFKASVETEHYIPAAKFFNMMFGRFSKDGGVVTSNCGCHG